MLLTSMNLHLRLETRRQQKLVSSIKQPHQPLCFLSAYPLNTLQRHGNLKLI